MFTTSQVKEIRALDYDDTVVERVASKYGISPYSARAVLEGKTYKNIDGGKPVPRQKHKRKLSNKQVEEIRDKLSQPYRGIQTVLAAEFGVSRNTIQRIQYGTYE